MLALYMHVVDCYNFSCCGCVEQHVYRRLCANDVFMYVTLFIIAMSLFS